MMLATVGLYSHHPPVPCFSFHLSNTMLFGGAGCPKALGPYSEVSDEYYSGGAPWPNMLLKL
jgi:hypothetical protein